MRRLTTLLALALLLAACNSKKKSAGVTVVSDNGKEKVSIDVNQAQKASEEMQKMNEELQKMPALSLDQLKAMLPEELMGVKRKSYNASSAMGAGLATAEYEINDSSNVKLSIYDCAGPAGAGIYSMQYLGMMNIQSESDDEYTKSIDFMGGRAFEHCEKSSNDCTLTWFGSGRLLVSLEGRHTGVDALKQAAKGLNLKVN
jgi:hypothetical protein